MSRTPVFYLERYNSNLKAYERVAPLVWNNEHTEREPAALFTYNACIDLFSILEQNSYHNEFPDMDGIHSGLPDDVSEEIKKEYLEQMEDVCHPNPHWITYADMYVYYLLHPEFIDYENTEDYNNPITIDNPISLLKTRVDSFLEVTDPYDSWVDEKSTIRIIYWIY